MPTSTGLRLEHVSKSFDATRALDDASLNVEPGEIHGLVGLNGSGKSTLVKILSGYVTPEAGARCELWGQDLSFPVRSPATHGIAVVQQDLALSSGLDVTDNVHVASTAGGRRSPLSRVQRAAERKHLREFVTSLGWKLPVSRPVAELTSAEQAMVSIVRALRVAYVAGLNNCLLILDEPTAYLTSEDTNRLFAAVSSLIKNGSSAIIISHRLDDILSLTHRVTVLREGRVTGVEETSRLSKHRLSEMMAGRQLASLATSAQQNHTPSDSRTSRLQVAHLAYDGVPDLSLEVGAGEILGCTGLVGCGIGGLPYAITGLMPRSGEVRVHSHPIGPRVGSAVDAGITLVPENRLRQALWSRGTVTENLTVQRRSTARRRLLVRRSEMDGLTQRTLASENIVARGPRALIAELSGGNQQKVVIARALRQPALKVLILHEPTSGVDVGARAGIYHAIRQRSEEQGLAVLLCSSDIEEVALLSHRVLILVDGHIHAELAGDRVTADNIALACQAGAGSQPNGDHATGSAVPGAGCQATVTTQPDANRR